MRIRKLELSGFKSFADPTEVEFAEGISGIVGPNGCGKSNIVDSLRWVLGEQAASRLRAGAMEDVLFNGTQYPDGSICRSAVSLAEVSLLLENDGSMVGDQDPPEIWKTLADVPEIQVTRRYFRTGESEYLINRRPCRLKDIRDLFLGTGVGTRAYSIVEQGQIDLIVQARPESLRVFIEEAAGTTLYRDRRLAAERKLARTRDHLARVNDRVRGIEKEIGWLRRMAKRAEEYRANQLELRGVELALSARRFDRATAELDRLGERRGELEKRRVELEAEKGRIEREAAEKREALVEAERRLEESRATLLPLRTRLARAQASCDMLEREGRDHEFRTQTIAEERSTIARAIASLESEIQDDDTALSRAAEEAQASTCDLEAVQESVELEAERVRQLETELESTKQQVLSGMRRAAELRNRIATLEEGRKSQREEAARLDEALAGLDRQREEAASSIEALRGRRREADEALERLRRESGALDELRSRLEADLRRTDTDALATARKLAETESSLGVEEERARTHQGYEDAVQAVMKRRDEGDAGIRDLVGEILQPEPRYERAVAAILGDRLQHVVVGDPDDAYRLVEELRSADAGRGSFVPLEPRTAAMAGDASSFPEEAHAEIDTPLLDVVRVQEGYGALARYLLGGAVVVRSLESGIALWRRNGQRCTLVTTDGDVVFPDGVVRGGSGGVREEKILGRKRRLEELRRLEGELAEARARMDATREALRAELESIGDRARALGAAIQEQTIESKALHREEEASDRRFEELVERRDAAAARLRAIREALERLEIELARLEPEAELEDGRVSRLAETSDASTATLGEARRLLEEKARAVSDRRVSATTARERESSLRSQRASREQRLEELRERSRRLAEEQTNLESRAADRRRELDELSTSIREGRGRERTEADEVDAIQESVAVLRVTVDDLHRQQQDSQRQSERIRDEISAVELEHTEVRVDREHVVEEVRDRYDVDVAGADRREDEAPSALQAAFDDLRRKVERLSGAQSAEVTFDELPNLERDRDTLVAQKEDLDASVVDLERTIARLNEESRGRFEDTFHAVNERFERAFSTLFGGGRGRLELLDPGNVLESGVEVQAQPPGMAVRSLSLLSGGQRSLTAVGLIFALLQWRPSPFCVLDEVDHALDDANVDRFRGILTEMSAASQFLVITHNKRTMECAGNLYGVTMEEPGVSRIVSVRLDG